MEKHTKSAVKAVLHLLGTDDAQVGLISFTRTPERWKGVPRCTHPGKKHDRKCVLPGWCAVPLNFKEFYEQLGYYDPNGLTDVDPALTMAMKDPTPGLTIVLVTDGDFYMSQPVKTIKKMRKWRKKNKLERVHIVVGGVGKDAAQLKDLAKEGGGGLYVVR